MAKKALALARRFMVYLGNKMVSSIHCIELDEHAQYIKDWENSLRK
jgi:hypothetical protein